MTLTRGGWSMATTVAVVLMLLLLSGCDRGAPRAQPRPGGTSVSQTVTVTPAVARDVQRTVETTGSLLAWEELTLNTRVPGTLARLRVDLGDPVDAGQVLVELDRREFELGVEQANAALRAARDAAVRARAQAEASRATLGQVRESRKTFEAGLNRARASLEEAELNLERSRALVDRQLIAKQEFDAARTRYEVALAQFQTAQVEMSQFPDRVRVAEAQLQSDLSAVQVAESEISRREAEVGLARKRLEDATLRSPIRGAVARRHVNVGEFLRDNQPVFTIVRTDVLKFVGTVPERAALDIRVGQAIELRVEPVPQRGFPGRVTRVSPAVDPASRSVLLEAEVPNPDRVLKPGLFARGTVSSRRDTGVVHVPEGAVSYFAGVSKIYVAADGRAHERQVKLGDRREGAVEVIEGVKAGEQVIVSDLGRMHDGAPIQAAPVAGSR